MGSLSLWHWIILLLPIIVAVAIIVPAAQARKLRELGHPPYLRHGEMPMSGGDLNRSLGGSSPTIQDFKYCYGCGKQVHQSARSCPYCGAEQSVYRTGMLSTSEPGWQSLYFNANGRIGRQQWWLSHLVIFAPLIGLGILAAFIDQPSNSTDDTGNIFLGFFILVWAVVYVWSAICLNAKRWHDRNYSGWMQLLGAIPFVSIWVFIENGFLRGTEGPNRFGEDPLAQ